MPNSRRIQVAIGLEPQIVGELIFEQSADGRQHSMFRYHENWLESPARFALSPAMPLHSGWSAFSGRGRYVLPDPICDTAPDDWGRSIIRCAIGSGVNELVFLLAVNDLTRPGALRYIDEQGDFQSTKVRPPRCLATLAPLNALVGKFERGDGDLREIAIELRGSGDSQGGARPKAVIFDGEVLSIAKFTSARDTAPVEKMEVATLNLAKRVGLRALKARLEMVGSRFPTAIIQRFDRVGSNRVHFISGHSFLNRRDSEEPAFYTEVAEVMRGNCGSGSQCLSEIRELYKRVIFMLLVSNTDDHMMNHGFCYYGGGRWVLSPLFDVNPQPERQRQLNTGISELSGFEASIEALIESAPLFEIDKADAASFAFDMASTIRGTWQTYCKDVGMSEREIKSYQPAFEHAEMTFALHQGGVR